MIQQIKVYKTILKQLLQHYLWYLENPNGIEVLPLLLMTQIRFQKSHTTFKHSRQCARYVTAVYIVGVTEFIS